MSSVTVDVRGYLPVKEQIELLKMPKAVRRRILHRTAKKVVADSKRRVRQQRDIEGRAFVARKRPRARKMISRLARRSKVVSNNDQFAKAGWSSRKDAQIAAKQQHGHIEYISAKGLKENSSDKQKNDQATRRQARALREAGFVADTGTGRKRKPTIKWIVANMKKGQAGTALRYLREQAGETIKQSWKTQIPARTFFGASQQDIRDHVLAAKNEVLKGVKHGFR